MATYLSDEDIFKAISFGEAEKLSLWREMCSETRQFLKTRGIPDEETYINYLIGKTVWNLTESAVLRLMKIRMEI